MTTMNFSELPKSLRAALKSIPEVKVTAGKSCVVTIDHTADQVKFDKGESWEYRTRCGRPISHPSAYARRGWSNMVYHSASPDSLTVPLSFAVEHGYIPSDLAGHFLLLLSWCK